VAAASENTTSGGVVGIVVAVGAVSAVGSTAGESTNLSGEIAHGDWLVNNGLVNLGCLNVSLVDGLGGVVVLDTLSLSLDDWLNLLDDVLVDVLIDDWGIYAGSVSLIMDSSLVSVIGLGAVSVGVFILDALVDSSADGGGIVLVVSVDLLVVNDWLNLLVNLSLFLLSVDDWSNFVVGVLGDVLVGDSVFYDTSVITTDAVIDIVLSWLALSKSSWAALVAGSVLRVELLSVLLVGETAEYFVYDTHFRFDLFVDLKRSSKCS